jgi:hypothetical protein
LSTTHRKCLQHSAILRPDQQCANLTVRLDARSTRCSRAWPGPLLGDRLLDPTPGKNRAAVQALVLRPRHSPLGLSRAVLFFWCRNLPPTWPRCQHKRSGPAGCAWNGGAAWTVTRSEILPKYSAPLVARMTHAPPKAKARRDRCSRRALWVIHHLTPEGIKNGRIARAGVVERLFEKIDRVSVLLGIDHFGLFGGRTRRTGFLPPGTNK